MADPKEALKKAQILADAWIEHLYTPRPGTVEVYVNARSDVVRIFYPDYDGRVPEKKAKKGKKTQGAPPTTQPPVDPDPPAKS